MATGTPNLLLPISMPQDIELLVPIAIDCRNTQRLEPVLCLPWQLAIRHPWLLRRLRAAGMAAHISDRRLMARGSSPNPSRFDAILTASETTAAPHHVAHSLTLRAIAKGVPTFTLQHGLENIGLTFEDDEYGEVEIASQHIFTWKDPDQLPDFVSDDIRNRCEGVGRVRENALFQKEPLDEQTRDALPSNLVLIGENLHWSRYSTAYKEAFVAGLKIAASSRPDLNFLIRAHPAGWWLSQAAPHLQEHSNIRTVGNSRWRRTPLQPLLERAIAVITSPSTLALDAAEAGVPVAVAGTGGGLDLSAYAPLQILHDTSAWIGFLKAPEAATDALKSFVERATLPSNGTQRVVARIAHSLGARPKT